MFSDLVTRCRSVRRFCEDQPIEKDVLRSLVTLARFAASGGNLQSTRYLLSNEKRRNADIFACLKWAGYLSDWDGPEVGEQPAAYIVMLSPVKGGSDTDIGIQAQTMLLGAAELGIGGCMLGAIDREKLSALLPVPEGYRVALVLALGYPHETIVIDDIRASESIRYYRDENDVHHVPKIVADDLILGTFFAEDRQ